MSDPRISFDSPEQEAIEYCKYCPKLCLHACPTSTVSGRETWVPQKKMSLLGELISGRRPWSEDLASVLYACTGCLRCQTYCAHGNDVPASLLAGRSLAAANRVSHPALADFPARYAAHARRERERVLEHWGAVDAVGAAFFPGCDSFEVLDPVRRVFDAVGLRLTLCDAPMLSSGHALEAAGNLSAYYEVAAALTTALARYDRILTSCPSCAFSLRHRYPAMGFSVPPVRHVVEVLEPLCERIPRRSRYSRAAYLDACTLGRRLGLYEEPRQIARRFVGELIEFPQAEASAHCSGAGALFFLTSPNVARGIAMERIEAAKRLGVDAIVTGCPTSRRLLRSAASTPPTVDIVELVGEVVGK